MAQGALEQFRDECAGKAIGSSRPPPALPPGQRLGIFRDGSWSRPHRSRCRISFPADTADRFPVDPRTDPKRRGLPAWQARPHPGPLETGILSRKPRPGHAAPSLALCGRAVSRRSRRIFVAAGSRHRKPNNEDWQPATPHAPLGRAYGRPAAQQHAMPAGQHWRAALSARATAQTRRARASRAGW